jgi:hypothetical protein
MTSDDIERERTHSTGRTGITYGILFAVLIALLFFFFWRGTGARDDSGRRPAPVEETG